MSQEPDPCWVADDMQPQSVGMSIQMHRRPIIDIIIPARDESAGIEPCLRALLYDGRNLQLRLIVALNGERADETAEAVECCRGAFSAEGHELIITRSPAGKAQALNAGDLHRRGCAVIYLDADAVLLPGTLAQLQSELSAHDHPVIAAPRLRVVGHAGGLVKAFARVWSHLPVVREGVIGGGCFAVNPQGRERWTLFPDISGDDAFACALFAPGSRLAVAPGGLFVRFPSGKRDLVAMRSRWLRSASEGRAAAARVIEGRGTEATRTAERRSLTERWAALRAARVLASLPGFILVDIAARVRLSMLRWEASGGAGWRPLRRGLPTSVSLPDRPRVRVIVVTYNSAAHIETCLRSVQSDWASLDIVVMDNGSTDASVEKAATFADVTVIRGAANRGFAAAVNLAAGDLAGADQVLLLNPDAALAPGAIDTLLALNLAAPDAGVIGALGRGADGVVNPASCLTRPSLWRAFLYGIGQSTGLNFPASAYRDATETRRVPAVSGACMVVTHEAWRDLGGFDARFLLYGEDVDFCLRARRAGYRPTSTSLAEYTHVSGASSASIVDRTCRLLAGDITLYRRYAGHLGRVAQCLIVGGVLLRLSVARALNDASWPSIWRRRGEWWRGYPPVVSSGRAPADGA